MNAAHKLEHKSVLYEEAMRVPFIMSFPGRIPAGQVDKTHLASNGLDLLPTLCDYADITLPLLEWDGRSVRALCEGRSIQGWRDYLVVESQHDRMIRTERFKYCRYSCGAHSEQLNDLIADPGEMRNLAEDPAYRETLAMHRTLLQEWTARTWDNNAAPLERECSPEHAVL
jgi:arylsulfatase A-like enzyme